MTAIPLGTLLGAGPDDILECSLIDPMGNEVSWDGYERIRARAGELHTVTFPMCRGVGVVAEWLRVANGEKSIDIRISASSLSGRRLDIGEGCTATITVTDASPWEEPWEEPADPESYTPHPDICPTCGRSWEDWPDD